MRLANFALWNLNFEQVKFWTLIHFINNVVIVLVCAKCWKLITLGENVISVQQFLLYFSLFFVFSSEVFNSGIKSCFEGLFFKIQFVKNVLVYVFGVFSFFCYCSYESFILKIILVSGFLLFICISYPLNVFRFDTYILRYSCAVPLLKTLTRLSLSIAILCLILFLTSTYNKGVI